MTKATDELIKAFPKVWCPNCGAKQSVKIAVMKADDRNDTTRPIFCAEYAGSWWRRCTHSPARNG
jgi:hypothetical protein